MSVKVIKKDHKFRIVDSNGEIIMNEEKKPIDGGGYTISGFASCHANEINRFEKENEMSEKELDFIVEALSSKNEDQKAIAALGLKWVSLLLKKNKDYGSSVFKTPKLCPELPPGEAIFVRMSDKIERIENLRKQNENLVSESLEDTIGDLGSYCLLWLIERIKNG